MTALRAIYYDTPPIINIPKEFQHKTVEVIMLAIDDKKETLNDFKSWLQGMPNIKDELFERSKDINENRQWAI